ncbi:hypothetical protein AB0I02_41535 [Streptomyces phaeochromogenes]
MSDAVTSKPDAQDMVVVHRTFRQSRAGLPELVRGLRPRRHRAGRAGAEPVTRVRLYG